MQATGILATSFKSFQKESMKTHPSHALPTNDDRKNCDLQLQAIPGSNRTHRMSFLYSHMEDTFISRVFKFYFTLNLVNIKKSVQKNLCLYALIRFHMGRGHSHMLTGTSFCFI